jgi:hypothetical protein
MRNNQPMTNEEYIIPEGLTLVSKTDLTGSIVMMLLKRPVDFLVMRFLGNRIT